MFDIESIIIGELPDWYIQLMTTGNVVGLQFSYDDNPVDKEYRDMQILNKDEILEEMQKMSVDTRTIPDRYVCFASDLLGGGDYYFLKLARNIEEANIIQLYHDGYGDYGIVAIRFIELLRNPYVE